MTLVSSIITDAYRESNLVAIVNSPTATEQAEGLRRLNSLILSLMGNEVGLSLRDLLVGGDNDQSSLASTEVPENARLVLDLSEAKSLTLPAYPYDGQRVAVADVGGNLATYNLTLDGNGHTIEGAASLALATSGLDRQWMYRADLGDWVRIGGFVLTDEMPFPVDFDDYFIVKLALRLAPRNSASLASESASILPDMEAKLRARYRRPRAAQDTGVRSLLGQQGGAYGGSVGAFNAGRVV